MLDFNQVKGVVETDLLVAFSDLTGFAKWMRGIPAREAFETLGLYTEFIGQVIEPAGGKVVKFIGDASFIVFPIEKTDAGILALHRIKTEGDRWCQARQMPCRHNIKIHVGPAACGMIGTASEKRFDVYGETINTAALLKGNGLIMTAQTFRSLAAETRKLFKKHTPPITYIPVDAEHRDA
ncbi:MAG: adenylate/guanylate cyclase domain-containing protein [Verrucomicrobiae bacterium]|nr:adenylate/guanylate cyclase domain-containing protein [Verrucomicrobiae bacterium]